MSVSPFSSAISQALAGVSSVAGERVTYGRGDGSISVIAVPGSSTFPLDADVAGENAAAFSFATRDWIFLASDLVIAGEQITPAVGDFVQFGDQRFVVTPDLGAQPYRFCDRGRTRIRVHTKEAPPLDDEEESES